ncbi:MAG: hypothetical protein E7323_07530 [Clostridiales bacterium]|nr:hypothetical protein [Clostridiales bacterium]
MERGIYFDGWFKHNHCYHPSLPIRSQQMLEDLERYHGTVLTWAGLGGGSISLPYLHHEAFGPVDPRMQVYGFMNDSEFIAECNKRGIKLFGIVFEVQGWEYPVVMSEDGKIIRMNKRAEEIKDHDWYGLREFSQNKWPDAFPTSLKDYYPDGIRNEEGQLIDDLWEYCATRDMHGNPIHAQWVEIKDHEESCYQMCRNNAVWREYLKKIIMLMIDAGVLGVQLDECELPMTAISSGGCFCDSCMKLFNQYLKERKAAGLLGTEWDGIDLDTFHYGEYLKETGSTYPEGAPFYRDYWEFQVRHVRKYFGELADFIRQYGREKYGREIQVSGNFYNMQPAYYPIENKVDIVVTEMDHTLFRQPYYYRFCAGFAPGKPVIIAENPYGGIIPKLLCMLDQGKGYDLYRVFLLEASVYGCNMSIPYGGWMGNTIKDSFWAPRELTASVQDFLYENERLYPRTRSKGAAVLYSYGSYYWRDSNKGSGANGMQDSYDNLMDATSVAWVDPDLKPVPFWDVIRAMSDQNAQYDTIMLPDGDFRPDDFTADRLAGYPLVIVPDNYVLTVNQQEILLDYAKAGGKVLAVGRLAEGTGLLDALLATGNAVHVPIDPADTSYMDAFVSAYEAMYTPIAPAVCNDDRVGIQRFDDENGTYVHILNYQYNADEDRIEPIPELTVQVKDVAGKKLEILTLDGNSNSDQTISMDDSDICIQLRNVGLYTVLVFS